MTNISNKMTCKVYDLRHNFPKLAEESGFSFNVHRARNRVDWTKIRLIDIENLIRDRNFFVIEEHLNEILNCALESEFDLRILDEGVVKMFRLAQLAVEYQQFCRNYLDRSVCVLREEITTLAQEVNKTKKDLREKEEEIKKLKRKTKHTFRPSYGNDNIANMILRTLHNGDIFPSTSNVDIHQYNKCKYCDKVFLNQLYLKSHVSRRHTQEIPEKEQPVNVSSNLDNCENARLNNEVLELKEKLKEMEILIEKVSNKGNDNFSTKQKETKKETTAGNSDTLKETKDAEVSTNTEMYLLEKIEEWKKEEYEKYNKEINLLRSQIIETVHSLKEKNSLNKETKVDSNVIEQLYATIKNQDAEIKSLKQELVNAKTRTEYEHAEIKKETEAQMLIWTKRAEIQSKQYESLLQKLDEVSKEAQKSREQAESERNITLQLQNMLQQALNNNNDNTNVSNKDVSNFKKNEESLNNLNQTNKTVPITSKPPNDRKTLSYLQKAAQELLNKASLSSESSSINEIHEKPLSKPTVRDKILENTVVNIKGKKRKIHNKKKSAETKKREAQISEHHKLNIVENISSKEKSKARPKKIIKEEFVSVNYTPGSPMKVVRAKLTEEVNNRLVAIGVDPLKNGLSQSNFRKQRIILQKQQESKFKKNPAHQKVRHYILTYLDSTTADASKNIVQALDISPTKLAKPFSFTSVLSNVKNKALSLVKSNDLSRKSNNKPYIGATEKSPSGSAQSSSTIQNYSPDKPKITLKVHSLNPERSNRTYNKNKSDSDSELNDSNNIHNKLSVNPSPARSIENIIKSPARRPSQSELTGYNGIIRKYVTNNSSKPTVIHQVPTTNVTESKETKTDQSILNNENSSDDVESLVESSIKTNLANELLSQKQTKGVLKSASSMSSLNKKKVLFDMDAIQMKSLSASPSQSITERSDRNEKTGLDILNLDDEEWDISSIENEPLKNDTKIQVHTRTSPKIAELKKTIEYQLARRSDTPSTAVVHGVDVLKGPITRAASIGGSNTSLGSSILDDSDNSVPATSKAFVKTNKISEKHTLDLSELGIDGVTNNTNSNESF